MDCAHLNDAQRKAVEFSPDDPLLVLAAAGTGKTEMLTLRMAHMIKVCGVPYDRILAVTFSNRAAREMRERASAACDLPCDALTVCTFHSACLRVMRMHPTYAGRDFTVLDHRDAIQLLTDVLDAAFPKRKDYPRPCDVYAVLNKWRNDCLEPDEVVPPSGLRRMNSGGTPDAEAMAYTVYSKFRSACDEQCCVDFADILCHAVRVCAADPDFLEKLRGRWTHVLIDEFQDTNEAQYRFVKLLTKRGVDECRTRITAVGDDCQTIHEHAGAKVERILDFPAEFPGTETIPLELNYRSSRSILDAANNLIAKNTRTTDKRLVCTKGDGVPIDVTMYDDEVDEANAIARSIAAWGDGEFGSVCVLYRINAYSQPIEHALRKAKIPFRVAGAHSFFERAEVRVAMSYLVTAVNPRSVQHVERAMRMPPRGIGKATLEKLHALAEKSGTDLVTAARVHRAAFRGKTVSGLSQFVDAVTVRIGNDGGDEGGEKRMRSTSADHIGFADAGTLSAAASGILQRSGLVEHFRNRGEHEEAENVEALVAVVIRTAETMFSELGAEQNDRPVNQNAGNVISDIDAVDKNGGSEYENKYEDDEYENCADGGCTEGKGKGKGKGKGMGMGMGNGKGGEGIRLGALVQRLVEESSLSTAAAASGDRDDPNQVTLMSIHRSKGLEWKHVHVAGFAEGSLPFRMSVAEGNLDAERRLGYVAITRARSRLTLSWPRSRMTPKGPISMDESRFVREMMPAPVRRIKRA